jgi:signal peptidase II
LLSSKVKLIAGLIVAIVVLDQASKFVVDRVIPLHHSIPVVENLFSLTYIRNTGAAFGIFGGGNLALRRGLLISFSLVAIGFIIVLLRRLPAEEKGLIVALSFILGGAIGNLIDRVAYGEVIDFFDFYWSRYHWPAFNFADSFITIGVAITLYRLIRVKGADPFAPRE